METLLWFPSALDLTINFQYYFFFLREENICRYEKKSTDLYAAASFLTTDGFIMFGMQCDIKLNNSFLALFYRV